MSAAWKPSSPGRRAPLSPGHDRRQPPIIGVPIPTSKLNGVDSFLSIVPMPGGAPVGSIVINAALLAVQILGTERPDLRNRMMPYKRNVTETVAEVDQRVQDRFTSN
jgi:5-(carboxyamino)imidazole ribonucleotide mutase